jgi:membrane protein YdbS with pleckstrin-like domain
MSTEDEFFKKGFAVYAETQPRSYAYLKWIGIAIGGFLALIVALIVLIVVLSKIQINPFFTLPLVFGITLVIGIVCVSKYRPKSSTTNTTPQELTPPYAPIKSNVVLFEGSPSQWQNLPLFILFGLTILLIPFAILRLLQTNALRYKIGTRRLEIESGILNKTTNTVLFLRVKDIKKSKSYWESMLGLGTITVYSDDLTDKRLDFNYIQHTDAIYDRLANEMEVIADKHGIVSY